MAQINSVSTLVLIDSLKKREFPIQKLLEKIMVDFDEVQRTKKIQSDKAFAIWKEAIEFEKDPLLHIKIHERIPVGAYHALELACLSSRSIGEAVSMILRYFNVINDELFFSTYVEYDNHVVEIKAINDVEIPAFYVEMVLAAIVLRLRHPTFQNKNVKALQFAHKSKIAETEYEKIFGCKVLFEQKRNAFIVDKETWSQDVLFSNPELLKSLEDHLSKERKNLELQKNMATTSHSDLIAKIQRFVVLEVSNKDLKINDAAIFLGMSVRSLQRYLQEHETSFSEILDQTRESLAKKYLADESLSIAEIGFLLGFSEQSTFQRAFKRWTNSSPMSFRKNQIK